MAFMKRLFTILFLGLCLVACNRHSEHWATITDMESIAGKAGDTTEVSYTEYSLSGTSCEWNFTKEDSDIIVVNSREELEKYIVCDGECTAPSVDFEKHSLVIAHGGCTNGIHQIGVSKFVKFADEKYGLYIDIVMGWTDAPELWTYAIITDKLSGQNSVELFVDIESL